MLFALALGCLLAAGAGAASAGGAGGLPSGGEMRMAKSHLRRSTHRREPGEVPATSSSSGANSMAVVHSMQADLTALRGKLGTLEAQNARRAADNEAVEKSLREVSLTTDRNAQLARAQGHPGGSPEEAELLDLSSELQSTKARIQNTRPRVAARLNTLAKTRQRVQGELLGAEGKAAEMTDLIEGTDAQLGRIRERMGLLPKQVAAFRRKINAEIQTRNNMTEQIPRLKRLLSAHYRENNRSHHALVQIREDLRSVGNETQHLKRNLLDLKRRNRTLELLRSDVDESRRANAQLRRQQEEVLDLKQRLEKRAGELSQGVASVAEEVEPISAEARRAQDRLRKSRDRLRLLRDSRAYAHENARKAVDQTLVEFAQMYGDMQQALSSARGARQKA